MNDNNTTTDELNNAITAAGYADMIDWDGLGIGPTQRAEEVSVERFIALANSIAKPRDDEEAVIARAQRARGNQ